MKYPPMNAWIVRYDVGKIDALLQYFVTINVDKLLRNAGQKSRTQAGDLRPLARRLKKRVQVL